MQSRVAINALIVALAIVGCNRLVRVEGTVTLNGQPLPRATIIFTPMSGGREGAGLSDEDGYFVIRELNGPCLMCGEFKVTVSKMALPPGVPPPEPGNLADRMAKGAMARESLPPTYSHPSETTLRVTIPHGGTTDVRLELTVPGAGP